MTRTRSRRRNSGILTVIVLIFAILGVFASCVPPAGPVLTVEAPPPAKPPEPPPEPDPPEEPEEPAWTPVAGHIYVMDAVDEIVTDYDAADMGWVYSALLSAVKAQVTIWNRDHVDQRHVVGGGP